MGKFDGILIATDLDGTLAIGKEINAKNIKAINYFKENGGKFTVCTGRVHTYLEDVLTMCTPNTYIISLNGATIVDAKSGEFLYRGYLPKSFTVMFDTIFKYAGDINDIFVYYKDCKEAAHYKPSDIISGDAFIDIDNDIHKIVFSFKTEQIAILAENEANELKLCDLICTRSWPTGVEILHSDSTKGMSALRLKELIGSGILVTAGDFENDIPMLKAADIGYAVSNAIDSVKAVADKITVSASDGAIASIINDIEALL